MQLLLTLKYCLIFMKVLYTVPCCLPYQNVAVHVNVLTDISQKCDYTTNFSKEMHILNFTSIKQEEMEKSCPSRFTCVL